MAKKVYLRPCPSKVGQEQLDNVYYVEKFMRKFQPKKVLDIGCGDGYLEEGYPDLVVGIDIEKDRIDTLKKQGLDNVRVGDATDIPFEDESFDMVVAKNLIEHLDLEDVFTMLSEVSRVLKPGGHFVVTTWRNCQLFWDKVDHVRPYSNRWFHNLYQSGMTDFKIVCSKDLSAGIPLFGILKLNWLAYLLADKFRFRVDHGIIVLKKRGHAKKNLTYVTNLRIPNEKANSIQVLQNCEAFQNAGVDVSLVSPLRLESFFDRDINLWDYYSIDRKFDMKRLPCVDFFLGGFFSRAPVISDFLYFLQSSTFYFVVFLYLLFKKPDIIYTRDTLLGLCPGLKNKFLELHDFPKSRLGKMLYKKLLRKFDKIIVISENLKKDVLKLSPSSNIFVAPDGAKKSLFDIDISKKHARKQLKIPEGLPIFLYSGSLYSWKGVDLLIEAFKSVCDKSRLYIVGSSFKPSDISRIKRLIKKLGVKNIKFTGHIGHKEVPLYLKAADFFVLPNLPGTKISELYTSPLKLFEYMLVKRPIIAADLPSIREILNDKNAILFEAGDVNSLEVALKKVLSEEADEVVDKAYSDGLDFTWQKRVENILSFMKNAEKN